MKNKSRIRITDLSSQIQKPELKPLSDADTTQIVGGDGSNSNYPIVDCRWCPPGIPGVPMPGSDDAST